MNEVQPKMDDLTLVQTHASLFVPSQCPFNKKINLFSLKNVENNKREKRVKGNDICAGEWGGEVF